MRPISSVEAQFLKGLMRGLGERTPSEIPPGHRIDLRTHEVSKAPPPSDRSRVQPRAVCIAPLPDNVYLRRFRIVPESEPVPFFVKASDHPWSSLRELARGGENLVEIEM